MANTQSINIEEQYQPEECYICMQTIPNYDMRQVCDNKHRCCVSCIIDIVDTMNQKDNQLSYQCPFCRDQNEQFISILVNDERVEYVSQCRLLMDRYKSLRYLIENTRYPYDIDQARKPFMDIIKRRLTIPKYVDEPKQMQALERVRKMCLQYEYIHPDISKWTQEQCNRIFNILVSSSTDLNQEINEQALRMSIISIDDYYQYQ